MKRTLQYVLGVLLCAFCTSSIGQNVKSYIPEKAGQYLPLVYKEGKRITPLIPTVAYYGALIEHESCISLKHSRCWSPTSELKTKREQGTGFGQITRAFREDGSTRFDALTDMRSRYTSELGELSWNNVKNRPDLQIRAIVLMIRESYQRLAGVSIPMERLAMADAAYNGGIGGTLKERTACGLAKGCDPNYWFNNVENYCLKSKKPLYAGRSACDINRHHAVDTLKTRLPKYEAHYKTYLERMQKT